MPKTRINERIAQRTPLGDLGDQNTADRLLVQAFALGDFRFGLPVLQRRHRLNVQIGAVLVALVLPRVTVADVAEDEVQVLVIGHERSRLLLEQRERLVAVRAPGGLAFDWRNKEIGKSD